MFVSDVMTSPVVTVSADTSIKDAARLLRDRDVAAAPVVDGTGALVGIVSEIDLLRGTLAPDPVAHLLPVEGDAATPPRRVSDVMTRDVQVLLPHSDLYHAARTMRASGIRSLPAVDGRQVVGVVSRSDLLHVLARDDEDVVRHVDAALAAELGPHHDVRVTVAGGLVTVVSGAADDLAAAALVAARVPGVIRVETSTAQR